MNERVDGYLDKGNLRTVVWKKLQTAAEYSTRAIHFQKSGKERFAIGVWRGLFKFYFPKASG
jgi:hypothetical protein